MTPERLLEPDTAAGDGQRRVAIDARPTSSQGPRQWDAHFARKVDDWAKVYEAHSLSAVIHQLRRTIALDWIAGLGLPTGERILEVGCGAGLTAVALAERGYRVDAVDRVPGMLERARSLAAQALVGERVTTTLGDAHELTFPAGSFGLVLALGVIPFLERPAQALAEMARVLKPGGYTLINSDNRWRLNHVLDLLLSPPLDPVRGAVGTVLRRLGLRRQTPQNGLVAWACSNVQFEAWLGSAGLEKVRGVTFGFGPFSFLGRTLLADATGVRVHYILQWLASRSVPVVRSTGNQYIVLARKNATA